MNGITLQDRISRGMGVAARRVGALYTVFRPSTTDQPINSRSRIITLYAAFNACDGSFKRSAEFGRPTWWGVFDAAYTKPGDYMVGATGTFFVASQTPLLPVECIKTNRNVTVSRTAPVVSGGYSGLVAQTAESVLQAWPASIIALNTRVSGNLPETRFGYWSILLPALPVALQIADVVADDTGRVFLVGAAEESDLGWRLTAREVAG